MIEEQNPYVIAKRAKRDAIIALEHGEVQSALQAMQHSHRAMAEHYMMLADKCAKKQAIATLAA